MYRYLSIHSFNRDEVEQTALIYMRKYLNKFNFKEKYSKIRTKRWVSEKYKLLFILQNLAQ